MLLCKTLISWVGSAALFATICLAQTRMPEAGLIQAARAQLEHVTNWPTPLYWQPTPAVAPDSARAMRAESATPQAVSPGAVISTPALFVAVSPCRLVDTRTQYGFTGAFGPPTMPANTARTIPVTTSSCGIPAAAAYSIYVTIVPPSGALVGYIKAWPDDQPEPNTAVLTDTIPGAIIGNSAIVPAGADGGIEVLSQLTTDLVIDLNGYFVLPGSLPLAGTAAAPAIALGDATSGLYSPGAGTVSIATEGVNRLTVRPDGDLDLSGNIRKAGSLFIHNVGTGNMGVGQYTLANNAGTWNTAVGNLALSANTTGVSNTAIGNVALPANTTGYANTAVGNTALWVNTAGSEDTATGEHSLSGNTTGNDNAAFGYRSLLSNTTGINNTATGAYAMASNTNGYGSVALGFNALKANTTGYRNTATGTSALTANTTGLYNTATGWGALQGLTTGNNNTALGPMAGQNAVTGNYNVYIANQGTASDTNVIKIGDSNQTMTWIAGIRSVTTGNGDAIPVVIDSAGQLGTVSSSRRVKTDIRDMRDTTETIMNLHPVEFRYTAHGPDAPLQFGLIAEEVADVAPELVVRKADGEVETVYYDKVNAMLLGVVQRQQKTIGELRRQIADRAEAQAAIVRRLEQRLLAIEASSSR